MKYTDTIGNEFIKGTSKDIVLAFDDDGRSRWEINESGLISLLINDSLILSFRVEVNIRDDEYLSFPFRPVPLQATLFKRTYHIQDHSIPTTQAIKKMKKAGKPRPKSKLIMAMDEQWEIGMEFHHKVPVGRLNFKTSIKVPLHGRTTINVWSDQPVRVNIDYINSQEIFICDQTDNHKFSMLVGSTPFELPIG